MKKQNQTNMSQPHFDYHVIPDKQRVTISKSAHVPRKKFLWRKYAQCCNIAHRPLALRPWVEDPWPCVRGKKLDFLQKLDVSDFVGQTHLIDLFGPKPSLTRGSEWPSKYLDGAIRLTTLVTSLTRCRFGSRSEIQLASCSGQAKTLLRWHISDPVAFCRCSLKLGGANMAKEPIWYASHVRTAQFHSFYENHPKSNRFLGSYLIFVNSINSGASVKKLTERIFSQLTWKGLLTVVLFHKECVILHTVCHFTHSV